MCQRRALTFESSNFTAPRDLSIVSKAGFDIKNLKQINRGAFRRGGGLESWEFAGKTGYGILLVLTGNNVCLRLISRELKKIMQTEKTPMPGQTPGKAPESNVEEFRQEAEALKQEVGAEIARLDAEMKRSQAFIDSVNAIGDRMNAIGDKINKFMDRVFGKK